MKKQELFDKTISILVRAYMNNTLLHGSSCGCAVGNLIYEPKNLNEIVDFENTIGASNWYNHVYWNTITQRSISEINKTGYSVLDILKIEQAFESAASIDDEEENSGYLGLMEVVDCLSKIHKTTVEECNIAKSLFTA